MSLTCLYCCMEMDSPVLREVCTGACGAFVDEPPEEIEQPGFDEFDGDYETEDECGDNGNDRSPEPSVR
ncbi:MAG: hypothetical protein LC793_05950 [Thermomicrobia bacterium]|nr:hypothetical protein [Thermomicrobia bacterium]